MTITCEQCLAAYRKPISDLCQRGLRNIHQEVRHQRLAKGESLFQEGEQPRVVYILQTGMVKLFRDVEPGHQATVRLVHPGELFGCTSLLAEETHSLSAECLVPSELCVFTASAFFKALEGDGEFARSLLQRIAKELRAARLDLLLRAEHDATSKIASHLLDLAGHPDPRDNATHDIRITRTALGDLSGVGPGDGQPRPWAPGGLRPHPAQGPRHPHRRPRGAAPPGGPAPHGPQRRERGQDAGLRGGKPRSGDSGGCEGVFFLENKNAVPLGAAFLFWRAGEVAVPGEER